MPFVPGLGRTTAHCRSPGGGAPNSKGWLEGAERGGVAPGGVVERRRLDEEKEWLPTAQVEWFSGAPNSNGWLEGAERSRSGFRQPRWSG